MEMPEGWKRNYHRVCKEYDVYGCLDEEIIDAFNLMKEMAEALEYPEKIGFIVKDTPIEAALNKFKEWR